MTRYGEPISAGKSSAPAAAAPVPVAAVVVWSADDISNLRKLAARRFDLVLLERRVGEHLISNDTNLRDRLVWQEPALESIPLVVGFTAPGPGQPDWAAIFERGLLELHASGEYLRILKRHNEWR